MKQERVKTAGWTISYFVSSPLVLIMISFSLIKTAKMINLPVCFPLTFRVRTSSGTFLARGRDKVIRKIEKKLSDFTFIPVGKYFALFILFIVP